MSLSIRGGYGEGEVGEDEMGVPFSGFGATILVLDKLTELDGRTQLELFVELTDVIAEKKKFTDPIANGAKFRDVYSN
ncbi:PREDICTED: PRUPE_2G084500 [Prunus dulcis]|uniref:PREDICTED: PRUPE_2G084500 n=1 Tax=Prunus dulcis TaxID=3755 RepID=A0A5E4GDK4_PRUDU|nr:PREDICTED: PRUPE_2G084500 [Prunus dulcis]